MAAVLGLYSRRIMGWSMQESMTSQLVVDALMMPVWRRGRPVALLHHSDQGSQYTSEHFQRLLDEQGINLQHESGWRGLEQLGHGELLQLSEDRAHGQQGVQDTKPGTLRCV